MQAHIEHMAVWVHDLESMRAFYTEALGGTSGPVYENPSTGFRSYFISFGEGARLELMHMPGAKPRPAETTAGFTHLALALGTREAVDTAVDTLRQQDVTVSLPRVTGDGYYEALILDPEGNQVELTD
jgi:lactoylglutathione lyase